MNERRWADLWSDIGLIPVFLAKRRLTKSRLPPECALGTRASSCLESLRAALGTEFPGASKGAGSQLSSQGARTAGKLAWPLLLRTRPAVRRQKRRAALVSGLS